MLSDAKDNVIASLLSSELFGSLSAGDLAGLEDIVMRIGLEKGEILIEEGTSSPFFYVVESGDIEVYLSVPGQENYLEACRIKVGSVAGEMSLLEDDVRSARVAAGSKASVIRIVGAAFMDFLSKRPAVGFVVMRNLAKLVSVRLRYTDQFVRHSVSD